MAATIRVDATKAFIHEAFGVSKARMDELSSMLQAAVAGFKMQMDAIQYMRTIANNNQEFALMLLYYDLAKE